MENKELNQAASGNQEAGRGTTEAASRAQSTTESNDPKRTLNVKDDEIYKFIVTHWHHHNQLSWNKLNVMLALETATLGGAFSVESSWVSYGLLIVGSVVGLILYQLVLRDWEVRDYNLPIVDKVHRQIKFDWIGQEHSMCMIPRASSPFSRGQTLLKLLMALLMVTNFSTVLVLSHRDKIPGQNTNSGERTAMLPASTANKVPNQLADSCHDQQQERAINVVAMNVIEKPEVSVNVPSANPVRNVGPAEKSKKPREQCAKSGEAEGH